MTAAHHVQPSPGARRGRHRLALALAMAPVLGCAAKQYRLPMTAAELAGYTKDDAALIAYLGQPDASARVCDPRSPAPHLDLVGSDTAKAVSEAFRAGKIPPQLYRRCMGALLRGVDAAAATALVGDVLEAALDLTRAEGLDADAGAQARLDALLQLYAERDASLAAPPGLARDAASRLQRDLEARSLGSGRQRRTAELLTLLQLELGVWQGRAVDAQALDALRAAGDERTLRWAGARLPDAALRAQARRSIVRLHLEASTLPEVRTDPAAVEDAVMRTGANAVSLARHPPLSGWIDPALASARQVVVEQRIEEQSARLLGSSNERPAPSLLPELPTRGNLHAVLEGISIPVTVCAPADELDVTPCVAPGDVRVTTPVATLDGDGVLRFTDVIGEAAAVDLAGRGPDLVVPFAVAGRRIAALAWPLSFAPAGDLVLAGTGAGARGPDLGVRVDARHAGRLLFTVSDGRRQLQAVAEWERASLFHVISRGGEGHGGLDGSRGWDGSSGLDGSSASCPSFSASSGSPGGDGSRGGDGGDGGPGGEGGDVRVSVLGGTGQRERIVGLLQAAIRSEGGPGGRGGSGGPGGSGGRGGRGGSGAVCSDTDGHLWTLSGGTDGSRGSDGSRGFDGMGGPQGRRGRVTFSWSD